MMSGRAVGLAALALAGVTVCGVLARLPRWTRGPNEAYVVTVEDAWAGRISPAIYDNDAMANRTAAISSGAVRELLAPTPPSVAVMLLPLAWVPHSLRPAVWLTFNLGAWLATCWWLARAMTWPTTRRWLALGVAAVVLLSEPLAENLSRGQIYLLLMPAAASIVAAGNGARTSGGAGLAAGALAKLWGGPVWVACLAARAWGRLRTATVLSAAGFAASLAVVGPGTWAMYLRVVLPEWILSPKATVTAYQTSPSFVAHLTRQDPVWNPHPLVDWTLGGVVVSLGVSAALVAVTAWRATRPRHRSTAIAASVVLAVLISPLAEQYHYLLILPSAALAVEYEGVRGLRGAALLVALVLLLAPLPFKSPELARALGGVLAYPRLAGGLVLWLLLVSSHLMTAAPAPAT